mgnify:CR=1 FL=1
MKAAKKRPRNATKRPAKPVAKPRVKAAPRKPAPSPRKAVKQRRIMIRFNDPGDLEWLGAQSERMGLGDAKGPGAATYARLLIRAARECEHNPIDVLRGAYQMAPPPKQHPQYVERVVHPPVVALPPDHEEPPEGSWEAEDPVIDVDDVVNQVVNQTDPVRRDHPELEDNSGRVRTFGERISRRPVDWSGR